MFPNAVSEIIFILWLFSVDWRPVCRYNRIMNRDKLLQMLRITGKYYIQHMSQKDIAEEEKISVPTVSRMISKAMDSGYVKISIDYSFLSEEELAEEPAAEDEPAAEEEPAAEPEPAAEEPAAEPEPEPEPQPEPPAVSEAEVDALFSEVTAAANAATAMDDPASDTTPEAETDLPV